MKPIVSNFTHINFSLELNEKFVNKKKHITITIKGN